MPTLAREPMLCVLHAMIDQRPFRIFGLYSDGRAECIYCEVANMLKTEPPLARRLDNDNDDGSDSGGGIALERRATPAVLRPARKARTSLPSLQWHRPMLARQSC